MPDTNIVNQSGAGQHTYIMDTINFASNKTLVLLIAVSKFYDDSTIHPIPNAKQNIFLLKKNLLKNKVLNITEKELIFSLNETKTEIERKLTQVARNADTSTTLIVYFAGHGIVSSKNFETYLVAANTTYNFLESDGINITNFRNIIEGSKAARKITIIDACYSGSIHNAVSAVTQIANNDNQKFTGSYVITSASKHDSANYPVAKPKQPTYFTGKLIEILKKGINNGKDNLTIRDVFEEIETDFANNPAMTNPQQSGFQNASKTVFAKNKIVAKKVPEHIQDTKPKAIEVTALKKEPVKFNLFKRAVSFLI